MKIAVIGTRGIPRIQGGVETHCAQLYPRLFLFGYNITLVRRSCYIDDDNEIEEYKGVKLKDIYSPHKKSIEAIVHSISGLYYAKKTKADIIHIHSIGPALVTPLAKLMGLKVVVTHHGADYERKKWGWFAKWVLKTGEKFALKYADKVITVSQPDCDNLRQRYNKKTNISYIPNGIIKPVLTDKTDYLHALGLEQNKYIFALGRFVEEKGFHNLIKAFGTSKIKNDLKLVIAGNADHESDYSKSLKELAKQNKVIMTGFVSGEKLAQLFGNAQLFILPSFHEGLPIALLEAMSYHLPVLVSDIVPNRLLVADEDHRFDPSDVAELRSKIEIMGESPLIKPNYNLTAYNWDTIALQTKQIYDSLT